MAGKFRMYVDDQGVPYSDYGDYSGVAIGRQRSILAVAERGLWWWNARLRGDEAPLLLSYSWSKWPANADPTPLTPDSARAVLIRCADHVAAVLEPREGFSVWAYPYGFSYDTGPGWRSGHAQAVCLQLLARAAGITGDQGRLAALPGALAAFRTPIADGGFAANLDGHLWFEKIADSDNQQPRVLNGHLFAVLGLLDLAARTGSGEAAALAEEGMDSALHLMPRFDLGDRSAYDVLGRRASPHYHGVHIDQCARLFELTGRRAFDDWRRRFESQIV